MKGRRIYFATWILLLLAWAAYLLAGAWLSRWLGAKVGATLLRVAQDKFNDPALFLQCRMREALWLATLALVWMAFHALLARFLRARDPHRRWRWAVQGIAGFVLLNVWVGLAARTVLFWAVLGAGAGLENYTQFQFKRLMSGEVEARQHAVLVGNSQTRAQINERLLNEKLGEALWTTELHFPGCRALDLVLIERQLERARPDYVICYVTEGLFYNGLAGEAPKHFLTFSDLPVMRRLGALSHLSTEEFTYGLLGDALPLFRCRLGLGQRIFGESINYLQQQAYDASLDPDLERRAAVVVDRFRQDAGSELQMQAFREFVSRCIAAKRRVVLLVGGYHPALMTRLPGTMRSEMLAFLDELQRAHPEVVLIPSAELPPQRATDYEDLNHVNPAMQARFTEALAGLLREKLSLHP